MEGAPPFSRRGLSPHPTIPGHPVIARPRDRWTSSWNYRSYDTAVVLCALKKAIEEEGGGRGRGLWVDGGGEKADTEGTMDNCHLSSVYLIAM
ncbi:hypothetical protein CRG98_019596 [Punica granatum]|uniref:Uncharacterized protein n=1 Tax=Punica granatum TaxID=22663 RepID=A0A2I0JUM2_PUNGR|nr:hypothetical protein CRG98_019596 [Punica granatum]